MAENGKKKFRWRYFIDKPFQIRFIIRFSVLIIIGLGISIGAMAYLNATKYKENLFFQIKSAEELDQLAQSYGGQYNIPYTLAFNMKPINTFQIQLSPMIWMSVLYLVMIIVFGLFISHKMAGPVYRIKKTLKEVADGKVKVSDVKFKLRKRDELKDLVDSLNDFLDKTSK